MIVLALAGAVVAEPTDFDAFAKAVEKCERATVAKTVSESVSKHGQFLIESYKEQQTIAQTRADLAERRRKLRSGERTGDTDAALNTAAEAANDRQRALDDSRVLDRLEQDMITYFRQQYLTHCAGRPAA